MKECPVSHLPVIEKKHWNIDHSGNNYTTKFALIGHDIIYMEHLANGEIELEYINSAPFRMLLNEVNLGNKPVHLIVNFDRVTSFAFRYKKDFTNFIYNWGPNFRLLVVYNVAAGIRTILETFSAIAPRNFPLLMADDYHDAMKTAMKFKSGLPVAEDLHHEELKHLTFQKKEFLSMLARMNWLNMLNMPVYLPAQADRSYPFFKAVEFLQKDLLSKEKLHRKALADQQNEYEQLLTQKTILLNAQIELNNKTSLLFEEEKQALNATMAEKKLELEQMSAAIAETSAKLSELCSYLHSLDIDEFQKNRLIEACSGIIENETIEKKLKIELTTADTAFVSMLQKMHPNLNQRELRIGLLVKLNYDNKEIARSVGISTRGIESIRYRMHKKLGLDKHRSIKTYFTELTSVRQ